ncbi:MAG: hypothetical protein II099_06530 [Firmicutes bacterium]|nr:hypothetical protein [Bacillota bacterium]
MKKLLVILIAVFMIFGTAACIGNSGGSDTPAPAGDFDFEACKTIGDLMALNAEDSQWGSHDLEFTYGFQLNGSYYRAKAEMTSEQQDALFNIDYSDQDYEEQERAIISEFEIIERQELDTLILSQEQLDGLKGKTGQELLNEGWTTGYGYNLAAGEFWMYNGPFVYAVVFDGDFSDMDDIEDEEEFIKDLKVKSAEFMSMGDVTNW